MPVVSHELAARVTAQVSKFKRGLRDVQAESRKTAASWKKSAAEVKQSAKSVGDSVEASFRRAGKAFKQFARDAKVAATRTTAVVTGSLVGITAAATKMGLGYNAMRERVLRSFETFTGSAERAKKLWKDVTDFTATTPFELPGTVESTQKLLAFGFELEKVPRLLRGLGDAVSGLGGSQELFNRLILAIGQIRAKGKASGEELRQLAEAGIPAYEILAKKIGVEIPEAMEMVRKGAISSDEAIEALMAGMEERFRGMTQIQSRTFTGLTTTLRDNVRSFLGRVTKPLFDRAKAQMASIVDGLDGERMQAVEQRVRASFERLGMAWDRLLRRFGAVDAGELAANALAKIVDMVTALTNAADKSWPTLKRIFDVLSMILGAVAKLIVQFPELTAVLIALRLTALLGLNQALTSFVALLWKAGAALLAWIGKVGLAKAATTAFRGVLAGLIVFLAVKLVKAIYSSSQAIQDYNDQVARSIKLQQRLSKSLDRTFENRIDQAKAVKGQKEQLEQFNKLLNQEQMNLAGLQNSIKGQEKLIGRFGTGAKLTGNKVLEQEQRTLDETKQRADQVRDRIERLREEIRALKDEMTKPAPKAALQPVQDLVAMAQPGAAPAGPQMSVPAFNAPSGPSPAQQARNQIAERIVSDRARAREVAQGAVGAGVSKQNLNPFATEFLRLQQLFQAGTITLQEYTTKSQEQIDTMQALGDAQRLFTDLMNQFSAILPDSDLQMLNSEFENLKNALSEGMISLDTFTLGVKRLGEEAKQADLLRQARGQFTQAEFQQALLQRAASIQQQRFGQMVDRQLSQMGFAVDGVTDRFSRLNPQLDRFGRGLRTSQQDQQKSQQAAGRLAQFFNSRAGQITSLFNNIQLVRQKLTLGIADTFRERREVINQLSAMTSQLRQLTAPRQPVFRQTEADFLRDPDAQSGVTIVNQFPQARIDSNQVASQVFDAMEGEGRRRGKRI